MGTEILAAVIGAIATVAAALIARSWVKGNGGPAHKAQTEPTRSDLSNQINNRPPGALPGHAPGPRPKQEVLVVDDRIDEQLWLVDLIMTRGYSVFFATSESTARKALDEFASGQRTFALCIMDAMMPSQDIANLEDDEMTANFFGAARDSGVRLCQYVRQSLLISESRLPIILHTIRDDPALLEKMRELRIPVVDKVGGDLRALLEQRLPNLAATDRPSS